MSNISELAAALNGHSVTDDNGEILEEIVTSSEDSAPQNETTVDEFASVEKPADSVQEEPKASPESETELAEDETGKRYVPESRFKEVYGKLKALEREQEATKRQPASVEIPAPITQQQPESNNTVQELELEMLFEKFPQFNPDATEYSRALDEMGARIKAANPNISRLSAAKEALRLARELTQNQAQVVAEARQVKALQADQGITSHVTSRKDSSPEFDKMTDQELEVYLKSQGQWN